MWAATPTGTRSRWVLPQHNVWRYTAFTFFFSHNNHLHNLLIWRFSLENHIEHNCKSAFIRTGQFSLTSLWFWHVVTIQILRRQALTHFTDPPSSSIKLWIHSQWHIHYLQGEIQHLIIWSVHGRCQACAHPGDLILQNLCHTISC